MRRVSESASIQSLTARTQRDVVIVEIGGTPWATSIARPLPKPFGSGVRTWARENTLFVHVTLVPWIYAAQELKTKPTQHSVKELRAIGIQPDILLCRSDPCAFTDENEGKNRAVLRRSMWRP